jgi:PKD repeat protein
MTNILKAYTLASVIAILLLFSGCQKDGVSSLSWNPNPAIKGQTVTFRTTRTGDNDVYQWSFGDGSTETSYDGMAEHVYTDTGIFIVEMTIYTDQTMSWTSTEAVHIVQ